MFLHYGAAIGEDMLALRAQSALDVLAACGVPASLAAGNADGTGQREAWRRFVLGSVVPVARTVADELRVKLDSPAIALDFTGLYGHDLAGRARALAAMVTAGVPLAAAQAIAGLAPDGDA